MEKHTLIHTEIDKQKGECSSVSVAQWIEDKCHHCNTPVRIDVPLDLVSFEDAYNRLLEEYKLVVKKNIELIKLKWEYEKMFDPKI